MKPVVLAAALLVCAARARGADAFALSSQGWTALSVGRWRDARGFFAQALAQAGDPAQRGEALFGAGVSALAEGKYRDALDPLKSAGLAAPGLVAPAARLRARAFQRLGDEPAERAALRQALELDGEDFDAWREMARVLLGDGDAADAWRAAERVLRMDPGEPDALAERDKARSAVKGDLDAALGLRRLTRPMLPADAAPPDASSPRVRVALYADALGRPATMSSCVLVADPGQPRVLSYDAASGAVQMRDLAGDLLAQTTGALRVAPDSPGSVLVSSAALIAPDPRVDRGDRELRGDIVARPAGGGFILVNESALEPYLYGAVSAAMPDGAPRAALEAEAVVARTEALSALRAGASRDWDLGDAGGLRTIGVSGELRAADAAVDATAGLVLTKGAGLLDAPQGEDSGGWTEEGARDGNFTDPRPASEEALERFLREPPRGLFSASDALGTPASSRWVLTLRERDLRRRARGLGRLGRIERVWVSSRTATGRAVQLSVVGSRGQTILSGRQMEDFLSPGSLRSTLLSVAAVGRRARPRLFLVWGAGTGDGRGFSRAGARGQAALGRGRDDILRLYFPDAEVRKE